MKYCCHCGKQIEDEAVICINCGCMQNINYSAPKTAVTVEKSEKEDTADTGMIILCVLIPLLGLILWATEKENSPKAAATYGKASLISFCAMIALVFLITVIILAAIGTYY